MVGIEIVSGRMGGGKSVYAVRGMLANAKKNPGQYIVTNMALTDMGRDAIGRERLIEVTDKEAQSWWEFSPPGSYIVIDEAQILFDARNFGETRKKKPEYAEYMCHIRKYRDEVQLIAQRISHVDKRIRDLANCFTYTISWKAVLSRFGLWSEKMPEIFRYAHYMDELMETDIGTGWWIGRQEVFDCYDSWAVQAAEGVKRRAEDAIVLGDGAEIGKSVDWIRYMGYGAVACLCGACAGYIAL